jgi:hypothetical protein
VVYISHLDSLSSGTLDTTTTPWTFTPGTVKTPGDGWFAVEDISLVHGFAGTPGSDNCIGKTVSDLAHKYGGIANAAPALGFASVADLQAAITAFCGG